MAITFTKTERTYVGSTGVSTVTTSTVTGSAIQKRDDPKRYDLLGLSIRDALTLLFIPDTYGEAPEVGSRTTWNSTSCVVRSVEPYGPDGKPFLSYVILEREA